MFFSTLNLVHASGLCLDFQSFFKSELQLPFNHHSSAVKGVAKARQFRPGFCRLGQVQLIHAAVPSVEEQDQLHSKRNIYIYIYIYIYIPSIGKPKA